ncbi:hypothetical protein V2J09_008773 [Rumex salicifolius]
MAKARNHTKSVDEDDDSDVELLSISSGDEDSSKASTHGGKGAVEKDDGEKPWDGEEPDRWKRVDESELARRVRVMREARAAPVTQKIEKLPSGVGKKVLNTLQSFPRGMECIDPLGLGIIDNKSLRLITDSSMPQSDRDKVDDKLREKLTYFSEKFDAKLFLSRIHQETSAADLEAGAKGLKADLQGRTNQKRNLVKENFDCFVSCKTTIDDIESKMKRIEEDPEGAGTAHLYNCIQGVSSLANRAFEQLFERQAQAEKIRSVQGMLQRFRTLFNLPNIIRTSVSKGEYDFAVREYRKAKSIVLPSHVRILKRVLEEVEKVMQEFKGTLKNSLEGPEINLTDLENTVRLLLELEPGSDPNQRIRDLFEKCSLDHETRMEILHKKMSKRATDHALDLAGDEVDALRGKYIHGLTAILIRHIPAFWKVSHSIFSWKFAKANSDSNVNASASRSEDKIGEGKYSAHTLDELGKMMCSTVSLYEAKVLNTFQEFETTNMLRPYMSDAIKDVSKASQALEAKDSAPPVIISVLRTMHSDVSKIYVFGLCAWMKTSIEEVSKDEKWIPVSIIERNKSPYTISCLPLAFRSVVVSAMDQENLMLQMLKTEVKTEDMFMQFQQIQESVKIAFLNCFLDLCGHLERIGNDVTQNKSRHGTPRLANDYNLGSQESSSDLLQGSIIDPHQRLLMVLSNIGYCKDELFYELYNKYKRVWSQSRSGEDGDKIGLVNAFSALEDNILEKYTFAKARMIRKAATNYLLDAGVQWGAAPPVKGIRDAAVELLHTFVLVHSEVFAGDKPLLERTLGILVEGLFDTLLSLFDENRETDLRLLDANGYSQLMFELKYLETVLISYITNSARGSLESLRGMLLEKATESVTEIIETSRTHRANRGGEEPIEEQGMTVSPDDLIALAQECSSEFLRAELERTRLNTACFTESLPVA